MNKFITCLFALFLTSCKATPLNIRSVAIQLGFTQSQVKGLDFQHLVLTNQIKSNVLHVYVEGDGTPWINRYTVSNNPTPKRPLALELMKKDKNAALYLGRPCYFGLEKSQNCNTSRWTSGRYGIEIIDSMESVILRYIRKNNINKIVIIGYSGGGVIAALLAERFAQTQLYITISANLDIDKWASHHKYSLLHESINPANETASLTKTGLHLVGQKDTVVPPEISENFINRTKGKRILYPDFTHTCCWSENWDTILKDILTDYEG